MPADIDADIVSIWERAQSLLICGQTDPAEVAALIFELHGCIERLNQAGLAKERELLRLVERLEWLTCGRRKLPYSED